MPEPREALRVELLTQLPHYAAMTIPVEQRQLGRSIRDVDHTLAYDPVKLTDWVLDQIDAIVEQAVADEASLLQDAVEHATASGTVRALAGFRDYLYELHLRIRHGIPPVEQLTLSVTLKDQAHALDASIRALGNKYPGLIDISAEEAPQTLALPGE